MAYTDVITVATGDTWTAANHNTYIRDNFAAGVPAIFTTKGDLAVASGVKAAERLGVGPDDSLLTAKSDEAGGIAWVNGGMRLIEAIAINEATKTISFTTIPTKYRGLELMIMGRSDRASASDWAQLRINDDAGASSYVYVKLYSYGDGIIATNNYIHDAIYFDVAAANAPGNLYNLLKMTIWGPQLNVHKQVEAKWGIRTGSGETEQSTVVLSGWWPSTSPINKLTITAQYGNFIAGSTAVLYGYL